MNQKECLTAQANREDLSALNSSVIAARMVSATLDSKEVAKQW